MVKTKTKSISNCSKKSPLSNDNKKQSCATKVQRVYRRFQYSAKVLQEAFQLAKKGTLSINKACKQYNIPKGTLVNKLRDGDASIKKMGPQPVLSDKKECMLAQ